MHNPRLGSEKREKKQHDVLETPGPGDYDPKNKRLYATTYGSFNKQSRFTLPNNDGPSPASYDKPVLIGTGVSHAMGVRRPQKVVINKTPGISRHLTFRSV